MCGICGTFAFGKRGEVDASTIKVMKDALRHRGPDGDGALLEGRVGLGHQRLSIIDLSHEADQPMTTTDGRYSIVFNGEIYNYLELREELQSRGHVFRTQSDTEVLLGAFAEWGPACLERFNGMWAFAIYDSKEDSLFAARDRFGVKPFYYHASSDRISFASEIKALLCLPDVPRRLNMAAALDYLLYNSSDHTAATFFQDISQLAPGHCLVATSEGFHVRRWWQFLPQPRGGDPAHVYLKLLRDSIRLRLRSDVPVGTSLSGGLDSTAVVCLMREELGSAGDIRTFTARYPGRPIDEGAWANLAASHAKAVPHWTEPNSDRMMNDLETLVYCQDEPFLSTSIYAQWEVMRLAHGQGMKVLLDGQGADEILAGYRYFYGYRLAELFARGRILELSREMVALKARRELMPAISAATFALMPAALQSRLYWPRDEVGKALSVRGASSSSYVGEIVHVDGLNAATQVHTSRRLQQLLRFEDRNSMAFGIETRLPFLDFNLATYSLSLDPSWKLYRSVTKRILRESLKGRIPEPIRLRLDKVGFETDEDRWFRQPHVADWVESVISSEAASARGILSGSAIEKKFKDHLAERSNYGGRIWKWLNLELWHRRFIDPPDFKPRRLPS